MFKNLKIGRTLLAMMTVALVAPLFIGTTAQAQDFGQLLAAVEKVETNLKAMIAKESSARQEAMNELRAELSQRPETSGDPAWQKKISDELATLRTQIKELASAQGNQELTDLVNDIEFLRAEILLLKSLAGENREQLASIDDDGFYEPPNDDPRVTELTEKLTELNTSLEAMLAGQGTTSKPNPSVGHGKIVLTGLVHEHYAVGQDRTGTFTSKRAFLGVKGELNDYAQFSILGQFAGSPVLLDGYITVSPHQDWSFRFGQYKQPFGTDFLTPTSAMPFVNGSLANGLGSGRDVGIDVSYRNKFNKEYSLKLTAGLFNGAGTNASDVNNTKNFVTRAEVTLGGMFTVAPNAYIGKTNEVDSLKEDIQNYGSSLTWKWRQEIVAVEYIQSKRGETKRNGWYLWGGHTFSIGSAFLKELQLVARYEQHDPDLDVNDNRTDRLTLGTNLFIDKKYTKIQLNYQINGEQGTSVNDNEFLMNLQVAF